MLPECRNRFMLVSADGSSTTPQKGGIGATIMEPSQPPSLIAINSAVVAMFALIIFSSISFTTPIWTLKITEIHVVMLFSVAFLLLVGYYLKINALRYYQLEPVRRNLALSAQTVTKSSEAIDSALKSVNAQITLVKDLLTANMISTNKTQLETFNQRLPETTEQFKKLVEATEVLKESRQTLEQHRQKLLGLRGNLSRMK